MSMPRVSSRVTPRSLFLASALAFVVTAGLLFAENIVTDMGPAIVIGLSGIGLSTLLGFAAFLRSVQFVRRARLDGHPSLGHLLAGLGGLAMTAWGGWLLYMALFGLARG